MDYIASAARVGNPPPVRRRGRSGIIQRGAAHVSPQLDSLFLPTMSGSISASTLRWDRLSEVMASFIEAWESNDAPPTIAEYLANEATATGEVIRVELIKIDMEK